MFSTEDTIVAIATPPGRGGIGVVRLSGPAAHSIGRALIARKTPLEPRHATFALIRIPSDRGDSAARGDGAAIDQVIATYFPGPASYTGDDVVEVSAHGSPVVLQDIVRAAVENGARLAEPGEFTLRAFLNGRIDLTQAEAVGDLINSVTPRQARTAFDQLQGTVTGALAAIDAALFDLIARLEASVDFPAEGYHFVEPHALASEIDAIVERVNLLLARAREGRMVREGLQIALVGKPNVGKSSLFNALAGASRSIVTAIPGTTRDLVTETIDLDGLRVTLVDTAGWRDTDDVIEAEGVRRSEQAAAVADLVVIVCDGSKPLEAADLEIIGQVTDKKAVIASNKQDLGRAWIRANAHEVSVTEGTGLDALRAAIARALDVDLLADRPALTNIRHIELTRRAGEALGRARAAALSESGSLSEEFVLADLQEARAALEEISGRRAPEDVLAHIFATFCVGK
jgi:tRNA modification GTPase